MYHFFYSRFQSFQEINDFSVRREVKGSERLLPVRIKLCDGIVVSKMKNFYLRSEAQKHFVVIY